LDAWFETPIDDGRWVIAYRVLVPSDLSPRLAELRIFPAGRKGAKRSPGTWSGDAKHVPDKGLTGAVLKKVRLSLPAQKLAAIFADSPDLLTMGLGGLVRSEKKPPAVPPRRGRKPHTDEFLERVANEYMEAMKVSPRAPVQRIAERYGQTVGRVRGWVYQARERKILRGDRGQGCIGKPALSPQALSDSKDRLRTDRKGE
jgi:transposase-like protein